MNWSRTVRRCRSLALSSRAGCVAQVPLGYRVTSSRWIRRVRCSNATQRNAGPGEGDRAVHVEEVDRQDRRGVGPEKRAPPLISCGRWWEPADRARPDPMAEPAQLASDATLRPGVARFLRHRRPDGATACVGRGSRLPTRPCRHSRPSTIWTWRTFSSVSWVYVLEPRVVRAGHAVGADRLVIAGGQQIAAICGQGDPAVRGGAARVGQLVCAAAVAGGQGDRAHERAGGGIFVQEYRCGIVAQRGAAVSHPVDDQIAGSEGDARAGVRDERSGQSSDRRTSLRNSRCVQPRQPCAVWCQAVVSGSGDRSQQPQCVGSVERIVPG
jgi:hypothetical protein